MEYFNNITLCIKHEDLVPHIITVDRYKYLKRDDKNHTSKIRVVRRGCYGTPALIAFDSLPTDIKEACIIKYGNPRENAVNDFFKSVIEYDQKAYDFYSTYKLVDGRYLEPEFQQTYIANANVLNAIRLITNDRKLLVKSMGGDKKHIWPNISKTVNQLKNELKHDLPENYRRLQDKLKQYTANGYITLVSGKFLQRNAAKVKDVQQEALLRQLFRKHNNFDNEQIKMLYNMVAENINKGTGNDEWEKISASTVNNYREKWNLQTIGGRRGESNFDNTLAMQVKRKAPILPLVYWTVDGWDSELIYQKTEIDNQGYSKTTYTNALSIIVLLDPVNKYPIGYAIGTHETPSLIREAFRNAARHTAELFGDMHRVHQLQTDNYGKKTLKPMYEAFAEIFTPAKVKNAKTKVIEPYFKFLNKNYCQFMENWSGFGVTSNKKSQPNAEYLNKIRHNFPDEAGCRAQLEYIIETERKKKQAVYINSYASLPLNDRLLMSELDYYNYLGETSPKGDTNRLAGEGLILKRNNIKRVYDSFDIQFRENSHIDWVIKYDPNNMNKVLAISKDDTRKLMLQEKYVQPMALYDRKEGDSEELKKIGGFNKEMKTDIIEKSGDDYLITEKLFNENPQLQNTLTKLVLCDSNGQHKNNKSAARIAGAKIQQKQDKKDIKKIERSWKDEQEEYLTQKVDVSKYL